MAKTHIVVAVIIVERVALLPHPSAKKNYVKIYPGTNRDSKATPFLSRKSEEFRTYGRHVRASAIKLITLSQLFLILRHSYVVTRICAFTTPAGALHSVKLK